MCPMCTFYEHYSSTVLHASLCFKIYLVTGSCEGQGKQVLVLFSFVWATLCSARWNRCQEDLNSFPLGELEETTGTPSYYVDGDSRTWNPEISPWMKQSTWLRIVHSGDWWSMFDAMQSLWCMPEMNEWSFGIHCSFLVLLSAFTCSYWLQLFFVLSVSMSTMWLVEKVTSTSQQLS